MFGDRAFEVVTKLTLSYGCPFSFSATGVLIQRGWWHMSRIPALGRWRWENQEFKGIFSYLVSLGLAWAP